MQIRSYFFQWVIEFFLHLSYPIASIALQFFMSRHVQARPKQRIAIVIVEQWFNKNGFHIFLQRYLEQKGFRVYTFNFNLIKGGFDDGAVALKCFIDRHHIKRCVLVGVSGGALTSYVYAQRYNGWSNIRKLICLGAPFRGSPFAYLLFFLKSGRQLFPQNAFLLALLKEKNKYPSRSICVSAKFDELVPAWSSKLPGVAHKKISLVGHNNLHIWAKEVFELILQVSRKAG